MSRTRRTEPEQAITSAMALFWRDGFTNVGTRKIDTETGITRFTLQTAYGGKMALFLETLDRYLDVFEAGSAPKARVDSLDEMAIWFEGWPTPSTMADQVCFGCLMINSMAEFGATEPEVTKRTDRYLNILRQRWVASLAELKTRGVVPGDFDVAGHAEILLGAVIGIHMVIRAAGSSAASKVLADATGAMVRGWGEASTDRA